MYIVGRQPERGAAEIDRGEDVDGNLLGAVEFPVTQAVGHDRHQCGRCDAEGDHVRQGVHLKSVHARRIEDAGGEAVERIEHHRKADDHRGDGEHPERIAPGKITLIRAQHVEDRGEPAERVAQRQRVRHIFQPALRLDQIPEPLFHDRYSFTVAMTVSPP